MQLRAPLRCSALTSRVLAHVRIIAATSFHPRTAVLTGTIAHSLNDLWHFPVLFMVVFACFAVAAQTLLCTRADFAT